MSVDNIKRLITGIAIVLLLLTVCIAIDSASEINNQNDTKVDIPKNVVVVNESAYGENKIVEHDGKVHTDKKVKEKSKKPTITVYGYPTCYTCWRTQRYRCVKMTYINYCPNCKKYGTLRNNPKGVADGEITCSRCDCDFCCYCGRDKVGSGGRHKWNVLIKGK